MNRLVIFFSCFIILVSCNEDSETDISNSNQKQTEQKPVNDSVAIQPIDLNNTLFMIHFETAQQMDSLFYAPPEKMQGLYDELMFFLDLKIQDLKQMQFEFKGAEDFINSAIDLMEGYQKLMRNDFPEVLEILKTVSDGEQDKMKIQKFESKFDLEIQPLAQSFFKSQDGFAAHHKIELVEY